MDRKHDTALLAAMTLAILPLMALALLIAVVVRSVLNILGALSLRVCRLLLGG